MDYEIEIKCNCFPTFTQKAKGEIYDFRLAIAKVMSDWQQFCQKQKKDTTPEVRKLTITATVM